MTLHFRPLTEADIPAYTRIVDTAFKLGGLMPMFYPNGKGPEDYAHGHRETQKSLADPISKYMIVTDTSLEPPDSDLESLSLEQREEVVKHGRAVGVSVWKFFEKDRTEEEVEADNRKAGEGGLPPGANKEMMADFFGSITRAKKEQLGGRRHALLHILATDPDHHRRGVGAIHLRYGLGEADRLALPGYLEASAMGQPLYERWGFEPIKRLGFDASKYGAKKPMDHMLMLRPAKAADAVSGKINGVH